MKKITILTFCCLIILGVNVNLFAQTPTLTPTASPAASPTPTVTPTPELCDFVIMKAKVKFNGNGNDKAKIKGTFPDAEFDEGSSAEVTIGSSSITIDGPFEEVQDGWKFEGEKDGAKVKLKIEEQTDGFNLCYEVENIDLTGTSNPINIGFENGDNNCEVEILLNGELKFGESGEDDSEIDCGDGEENNIMIGSCDTGVKDFEIDDDGRMLCEEIIMCSEDVSNHGEFVNCVSELTSELKKDDLLVRNQKGKIQRCTSRSDIGKGNNRNSLDDDSSDNDSKDDD